VDEESLKGIKTDKQTSTDQVQVGDFNEYESSSNKPKIKSRHPLKMINAKTKLH